MRQKNIDVIKGMGILLVMLYHSASHFPVDITTDPIVDNLGHIIDSFFMQLFFYCSGYLIVKKENLCIADHFMVIRRTDALNNSKQIGGGIYKRFRRLLIPYFCFAFINVCLRALFSNSTRSGTDFFDGILNLVFYAKYYWFLFVLFIIEIGFRALIKHFSNVLIWLLIGFFLSFFSFYYPIELFHIDRICEYFLYVVIGSVIFLIEKKYDINHIIFDNCNLSMVIGVFYVAFFLINKWNPGCCTWFFRFLIAFFAVLFTYSISFKLSRLNIVCFFLTYFGRYSLQYYLIHILLLLPIYYFVGSLSIHYPIISQVFIFLIIIFITSCILYILKKIPGINIFLGL